MASPFRSVHHDPNTSSPALPSLDQIQFQALRRPPNPGDSTVMSISDDVNLNHSFTNGSSFLRQEQSAIDLTTPCKPPTEPVCPPLPPPPEDDVEIISLAFVKKPKRKRGERVLEKKPGLPRATNAARSDRISKEKEEIEADQPWKKYLKDAAEKEDKKGKEAKAKAAPTASKKKGKTVSHHFANLTSKDEFPDEEAPAPPKKDANEPLDLEAAMRRRKDWTPPPADSAPGSNAQTVDFLSSAAKSSNLVASKETLENLLKNFGYPEEEPVRSSVEPPDGDHQVLRKRKLIETVSIKDAKSATSERALPNSKTTKKRPRTITELATAAYVVPVATEQEEASALPLETVEDEAETTKGKGKKRSSKAKKAKTMAPLEPVLLSPTAALRQAANQDYVFGTSSQLAREHSPTFLRDLQSAIQASNSRLKHNDHIVTPINSDAIEPDARPKLWGVGARDEDGRVLDLEVINLADTSPAVTGASEGPNPFGYIAPDKHKPTSLDPFPSEDSFPDIDDLLGKVTAGDLARDEKEVSPFSTARPATFQAEEGSAGAVERDAPISVHEGNMEEDDIDLPPPRLLSAAEKKVQIPVTSGKPTAEASKPKFEMYTDTQLAREISSYGFKPVKRRTAMLALLDQCWASKQRPALSSLSTNHPFSTTSESQAAAKVQRAASGVSFKRPPGRPRKNSIELLPSAAPRRSPGRPKKNSIEALLSEPSAKRPPGRPRKNSVEPLPSEPSLRRPRGRPRKDSILDSVAKETSTKRSLGRGRKNNEIEIMSSEPPPSAQPPPPSPKRSRGRSKKTAEKTQSAVVTVSRKRKSKKQADVPVNPEVGKPRASPRGKRRKSKEVMEIPDSASEGSDSVSRYSSPKSTFSSPPPVDVSLSVNKDIAISLTASSKTREPVDVAPFKHITKAIMTAPPTTDAKKPSFHEMMLMYDPIVVEDLATWLNTGPLSRVGHDGEVSPAEVKQWCESKSVCCLWRETMKGKDRKRY